MRDETPVMGLEELSLILSQVTAFPGWTFKLYYDKWEGLGIRMEALMLDSRHPGKMTVSGINSPLPPMQGADQLINWIAWRILRIQSHEVREWVKVNGVIWSDPHNE